MLRRALVTALTLFAGLALFGAACGSNGPAAPVATADITNCSGFLSMSAVLSVASTSSLTSTAQRAGTSSLVSNPALRAMCIVQFATPDFAKSMRVAVAQFDSSTSSLQRLAQIQQFTASSAKIKSGVVGKNSFEAETPSNSGGVGAYVAFVHGPYEVQLTSVQSFGGLALVSPKQLVALAKQVDAALPSGG